MVFFRAAPLAAPAVVRSTAGCGEMNPSSSHEAVFVQQTERLSTALTRCTAGFKNKKAVKSDPGERTQVLWTQATPEGSGSGLTAQFAAALTPSRTNCITHTWTNQQQST